MKKFFGLLAFLCCFTVYLQATVLPDSILLSGTAVDTSQVFRLGYFTTFGRLYFGSFFEAADHSLHFSYVDNYELFYFKSTDRGESWVKEKIVTGHEGDIFNANITADNNGKVFIGFTVHPDFNYANPTAVAYGSEFHYILYCVNNLSGSWTKELVSTYSGNAGPRSATLFTDGDNNVHLISHRYGWNSYGGTIWENIRYSASNSWGSTRIVKEFTDADINQFVYDNIISAVSIQNKYALVCTRQKQTNWQLFVILGEDSTWQQPQVIENNIASAAAFSAAYTPSDHIYIAYLYNTTPGKPVLKVSKDFDTAQVVNLNLAPEDTLVTLRLTANSDGLLTMVLWRKNKAQSLLFSEDGFNWSEPVLLDSSQIYYFAGYTPRTNPVLNSFSESCMHIGVKAGPRINTPNGPFGPDTLFFGTVRILKMASAPELYYPADNSELDTTSAEFVWGQSYPDVTGYWFELADNPEFNSAFIDSALTDTSCTYDSLKLNKSYYWRVRAKNLRGWGPYSGTYHITTILVSVKDKELLPTEYSLSQNYPNPFNPVTFIEFAVKEKSFVQLSILNILGKEVKILLNEEKPQGYYRTGFDASSLPSGVYFYRIKAGSFTQTRKMILLK